MGHRTSSVPPADRRSRIPTTGCPTARITCGPGAGPPRGSAGPPNGSQASTTERSADADVSSRPPNASTRSRTATVAALNADPAAASLPTDPLTSALTSRRADLDHDRRRVHRCRSAPTARSSGRSTGRTRSRSRRAACRRSPSIRMSTDPTGPLLPAFQRHGQSGVGQPRRVDPAGQHAQGVEGLGERRARGVDAARCPTRRDRPGGSRPPGRSWPPRCPGTASPDPASRRAPAPSRSDGRPRSAVGTGRGGSQCCQLDRAPAKLDRQPHRGQREARRAGEFVEQLAVAVGFAGFGEVDPNLSDAASAVPDAHRQRRSVRDGLLGPHPGPGVTVGQQQPDLGPAECMVRPAVSASAGTMSSTGRVVAIRRSSARPAS